MQPSKLVKTSDLHNTVTFVVLEPDTEDLNGDIISKDEIIKTAHEFVLNLSKKYINVNHEEGTEIDDAKVVESYISNEDTVVGGEIIKSGSRFVGIKFSSDMYEQVKTGEIVGVSMEGFGYSYPIA